MYAHVAGEENLLMDEDRHYPSESILVHEFAHTVMAVGMNEDQRQAVISAYFNARSSQLYKSSIYMMANADEYWAEGTQAWFEATVRVGRQPLKHRLFINSKVFGDLVTLWEA